MGVIWTLGWVLILMGIASAQDAKPPDRATPIRVTADKLVIDSNTHSAEFTGNAKAVQGKSVITADRLKVVYAQSGGNQEGLGADSIEFIEAHGHVRIELDNRVAVSEQAVYSTREKKLVLSGAGTKVTSGPDMITGSKITYYRDNGRVEVVGDDKKPVTAIIHSNERGLN